MSGYSGKGKQSGSHRVPGLGLSAAGKPKIHGSATLLEKDDAQLKPSDTLGGIRGSLPGEASKKLDNLSVPLVKGVPGSLRQHSV